MKLAIMQPYLFPYIGYFQLVASVDKFVVYDDVNFIKGGWINRNNLLINKSSNLFTLPLEKPSPFSLIKNTNINTNLFANWRSKFLKSIEQSYKKSPHYNEVFSLVSTVLEIEGAHSISELNVNGIKKICEYLQIETEILDTSSIYGNNDLKAQNRVLDICDRENATQYINVIGGVELYSKEVFKANGIDLNFIKSEPINYEQFGNEFAPWLSIIDVLMFNSVEETQEILNKFELV